MTQPPGDELACRILTGRLDAWPDGMSSPEREEFMARADYHGVAPLVHDHLYGTRLWQAIPDDLGSYLGRQAKYFAAIEMARAHDLKKLKGALDAAGVRALLLKGASLAYTHYRKPYLRLGVDTDLWIGLDCIRKVSDVLAQLGLTALGPVYKSHQFTFMGKGPGGVVMAYDVHWRASNLARFARVLEFEQAWRQSVEIRELDGWRALNPNDALLLACMHRANTTGHDPNRLIWLYDIHLLVASMTEQELCRFGEGAVAANVQDACLDALVAAAGCLGTVVPPSARELLETASGQGPKRAYRESQLALVLDDLRHLPDSRSRAAMLRELFFPSFEELLTNYGKQAKAWVPVLYVRYLVGGLARRLTLH